MLMAIRNRLKTIRHELQINYQADMARMLGISQYQYNRYERQRAQPTLEVALRIARKLNLPVEYIFYLDGDPE